MKAIIKIIILLIKNKNMKNLNFKKDWKTTVTGIVMIILLVLNALNIVTPEQSEGVKSGVAVILDAFGGGDIFGVITTIVIAIGGILHLFNTDPEKKDNK